MDDPAKEDPAKKIIEECEKVAKERVLEDKKKYGTMEFVKSG